MPEEEKKTVDIDTSGPEVEVELTEIKQDKNETVEKAKPPLTRPLSPFFNRRGDT